MRSREYRKYGRYRLRPHIIPASTGADCPFSSVPPHKKSTAQIDNRRQQGQRRFASLSQPAWNFDIKIPLVRGTAPKTPIPRVEMCLKSRHISSDKKLQPQRPNQKILMIGVFPPVGEYDPPPIPVKAARLRGQSCASRPVRPLAEP